MTYDNDIKIASDFPSREKKIAVDGTENIDPESIRKGAILGEICAKEYIKSAKDNGPGADMEDSWELFSQRAVLLSFAVVSCFEKSLNSDYASAAKTTFFGYLKSQDPTLYAAASDNGALSFYYLAFRRGNDLERSIGQTFAMLCSHDGDPVYQELGEAIYCWFTSVVKEKIESCEKA